MIPVASGGELACEVFGAEGGTPLLISTGTGLSWLIWHDIAKAIAAEGYSVICYDHRGVGSSTRGSAEITVSNLAADANALLDALGVERANVLGWSLGSAVAQELALAHPERVEALVLLNTWHHVDAFQRDVFAPIRHLWSVGETEVGWALQRAVSFSPELLESPAFDTVMAALSPALPQTDAQRQTVVEQWDADLAHDTRDRLHRIACPTIVVAGEQDLLTPLRQGQAVADLIPGAELKILREAGSSHALAWERTGEFLSATLAFLGR